MKATNQKNAVRKMEKASNGITLIALVVTIVVILILAGISISMVLGNNGLITKAKDAKTQTEQDAANTETAMNNLYDEMMSFISENNDSDETIDFSNLEIGEAINTDKYGWKVNGYTVTTEEFETGEWRLFYQDSNYTYLITNKCIGEYWGQSYVNSYYGKSVDIVGQKLSPMISSLCTESVSSYGMRWDCLVNRYKCMEGL